MSIYNKSQTYLPQIRRAMNEPLYTFSDYIYNESCMAARYARKVKVRSYSGGARVHPDGQKTNITSCLTGHVSQEKSTPTCEREQVGASTVPSASLERVSFVIGH